MPVLIGLLQEDDHPFDYRAILLPKQIGPGACAAIPALTERLQRTQRKEAFFLKAADEALQAMRGVAAAHATTNASSPGYFDPTAAPSAPAGGDAQQLCAAFGASDVAGVERVLRKASYEDEGYVFAFERPADLVRALALPEYGVGTAYASFERDEFPEGLSADDLMRTG